MLPTQLRRTHHSLTPPTQMHHRIRQEGTTRIRAFWHLEEGVALLACQREGAPPFLCWVPGGDALLARQQLSWQGERSSTRFGTANLTPFCQCAGRGSGTAALRTRCAWLGFPQSCLPTTQALSPAKGETGNRHCWGRRRRRVAPIEEMLRSLPAQPIPWCLLWVKAAQPAQPGHLRHRGREPAAAWQQPPHSPSATYHPQQHFSPNCRQDPLLLAQALAPQGPC